MKTIKFDKCNGMKGIVRTDSRIEPVVTQGMAVVLLLNKVEVHIEVTSVSEDRKAFVGKVLEIGGRIDKSSNLGIGDEVPFSIDNIAYPLDKGKSIT